MVGKGEKMELWWWKWRPRTGHITRREELMMDYKKGTDLFLPRSAELSWVLISNPRRGNTGGWGNLSFLLGVVRLCVEFTAASRTSDSCMCVGIKYTRKV